MQVRLAAESHVPCFQERVGTGQSRYMIAVRLPWRLRARPSATLHEIQVRSEERTRCLTCYKMTLSHVKGEFAGSCSVNLGIPADLGVSPPPVG